MDGSSRDYRDVLCIEGNRRSGDKLAVYATEANLQKYQVNRESQDETRLEKEHELELEGIMFQLSNVKVMFKRHTASKADVRLHSEVNAQNISDMLEKQHVMIVGVARIDLPTPIKTTTPSLLPLMTEHSRDFTWKTGSVSWRNIAERGNRNKTAHPTRAYYETKFAPMCWEVARVLAYGLKARNDEWVTVQRTQQLEDILDILSTKRSLLDSVLRSGK
ncbi:hypothetical protein PsorP6_014090 [Peronosclerospora sorghi]|uniref:Uncharacterized protein n=1 Tax=Peronosclerospora sorghi TaxID=230839 RepID=A0ACC0VGC1_9STRA|nr:hypothetical protein PsorP6_014090 [Peronosclerospora sorghi]